MGRPRRTTVEDVSQQILEKNSKPVPENIERVDFLHSGSIILNLAASQKGRDGGWARGRIINLVGDGSSGKTLTAVEALVNAYYHPTLESVIYPTPTSRHFTYWNKERVMDFPLEQMYGTEFVNAVEWSDKCRTVEEWGRDVLRKISSLKKGEFFIGVADSLDSMDSEEGKARLDKSIQSDKPIEGAYGMEKAKFLSNSFFKSLCDEMDGKDATLFLISQVREKIDKKAFGEKYYRAGGKALDFYTHQVPWLAQISKSTNEYKGEKRAYGVELIAHFKRNKSAKPFREATFNVIFDYGIDNIGSMANFLSAEQIRKTFEKNISRKDLISLADSDKEVYEKLVDAVEEYWKEIEENTNVVRKPRFGRE